MTNLSILQRNSRIVRNGHVAAALIPDRQNAYGANEKVITMPSTRPM